MFIATLSTIAKLWKEPKCPLTDKWIKEDVCISQWRSTLVAQSVKQLTLSRFMFSLFVSLSPRLGSLLSAQTPMRGSNSRTARSCPEPKSAAQPTEPPRRPYTISSLFIHPSVDIWDLSILWLLLIVLL